MIEIGGIRAVVTDIEGTTSSLAFVKDVLFPYARRAIPGFLHEHEDQLAALRSEIGSTDVVGTLLQWMDEDRKITPLKRLQGMVWKIGYESGELHSHVYDDAVRGLRRWHDGGLRLFVYSSGSIEAQKLLFGHTTFGDLSPLFCGYFDTTTGPKLETASYTDIARVLELPPDSIVFLSDHTGETRAAAGAGMRTVVLARAGTEANTTEFPVARSFDDIALKRPL